MDVDLESAEIIFAQKLACGEPPVRARALKTLRQWITTQSETKAFVENDMMRLCKGLHYVMWMQDKMLMQEELAEKIGALLDCFSTEKEKCLYVKCIFKSLGLEWVAIDRWRMDKFLMLLRRVIRVVFAHLKGLKWKKSIRDQYVQAWKDSVITTDKSMPEGLKFHFASLFLDELDFAGELNKKQVVAMLEPFMQLLGNGATSDYMFDSIVSEIFMNILIQFQEMVMEIDEADLDDMPACVKMDEKLKETEGIKFDYAAMSKLLIDIGKAGSLSSARRKRMYNLAAKFQLAAEGKEPMPRKDYEPECTLDDVDMKEAEERVLQGHKESQQMKKQHKHSKAIPIGNVPTIIRDNTQGKIRKEMKQKARKIIKQKIKNGIIQKKTSKLTKGEKKEKRVAMKAAAKEAKKAKK